LLNREVEIAIYDWRKPHMVSLFKKGEKLSGQLQAFNSKKDFRIYFGVKNHNRME